MLDLHTNISLKLARILLNKKYFKIRIHIVIISILNFEILKFEIRIIIHYLHIPADREQNLTL